MKRVGRKDTAPELIVRSFLHRCGLRFRLHVRGLPGTPDIVLPRHRTVVFVHGCFWHGHHCTHGSVRAKTNVEYWDQKIAGNQARDRHKAAALKALGWKVERIWECQCKKPLALAALCVRIAHKAEQERRGNRSVKIGS